MEYLDCRKIYTSRLSSQDKSLVEDCIKYIDRHGDTSGDLWHNQKTGEIFSLNRSYKDDLSAPFLAPRGQFVADQKYGTPAYLSKRYISKKPEYITEDVLLSDSSLLEKYQQSKIMIIGAGPSALQTQEFWKSEIKDYDYIWSCNHYYQPDFLKNIAIDLVTLGNEVDYSSSKLCSRLAQDGSVIGIDTIISRQGAPFYHFIKQNEKNVFFYSTRYFGKVGTLARMIVLASIFGAKKIGFVGMDGVSKLEEAGEVPASVFEKKNRRGPSDYEIYRKHYVMLWDYLFNELKIQNVEFYNYGHSCEYNMVGHINPSEWS